MCWHLTIDQFHRPEQTAPSVQLAPLAEQHPADAFLGKGSSASSSAAVLWERTRWPLLTEPSCVDGDWVGSRSSLPHACCRPFKRVHVLASPGEVFRGIKSFLETEFMGQTAGTFSIFIGTAKLPPTERLRNSACP
uniref:Uncharacterized protein n=1 Tax=Molossus molossus TaxID=27622 RepID=A0A7J8HGR1_MOLMO|nr:hypothetical protein HJG59_010925 [Molossus molossus]